LEKSIIQPVKNLFVLGGFLLCCISALIINTVLTQTVFSQENPVCPEGNGTTSYPAFAEVGKAPAVGIWKKLAQIPSECHISADSPVLLSVAIAGTFSYQGSVEDIAGRLGAVSQTQGLKYWSASDNKWRELVEEATALKSANKKSIRADFTANELLSGQTLYFAQNDTRSWGLNVFSMNKITSSADHLTVVSQNTKPVRIGLLKLFDKGDLQSVVFLRRANNTSWQYYSLAVIQDSALPAPEKSLVNRQAALFRYLSGQQQDKEPPLAP